VHAKPTQYRGNQEVPTEFPQEKETGSGGKTGYGFHTARPGTYGVRNQDREVLFIVETASQRSPKMEMPSRYYLRARKNPGTAKGRTLWTEETAHPKLPTFKELDVVQRLKNSLMFWSSEERKW
jgi:hypothetical protein